ncbi:hypothetical protein [Brucella intermedia]|uniref:hypothetical protein n=1 Tax=Brucella intermedia TaxID=94625 RepID=UPI00124D6E47|nr:hypothetical protein [Brucella intermedia]KAB2720997.1 hypothetical protein F9L02_23385 [Brucella intermedia]
MRLLAKTDEAVVVEMSYEQALTIVALVRESCFGTIMHGFETRVGHSPKAVGEIGTQLNQLLEAAGISE